MLYYLQRFRLGPSFYDSASDTRFDEALRNTYSKYLMKEHSQSLFIRDLQLRSERSRIYSDFVIPAVIID